MKIPFHPKAFAILLGLIFIIGSFSGVNKYQAGSFPAAVAEGWRDHNIAIIITGVLTAVLVAWLFLLFLSWAWNWLRSKFAK